MQLIQPPVNPDSLQATIANLQDALLLLLQNGTYQLGDADRQAFVERLRPEREAQKYGGTTKKLVAVFQELRHLRLTGEVDEATAQAINAILRELGVLDAADRSSERQRVVSGRVRRSDQQPFNGVIRAFHVDEPGAIRLGDDTTDTEGNYTIRYEPWPEVSAINLRVSVLDESGRTVQNSDIVRAAGPLQVIDLVVPFVQPTTAARLAEGRIVFDHGAPAEGLPLRLYRLGFGGAEGATRLAETTTREHGVYSLSYAADSQAANLEVRAVDADGKEIALSKIIKNASEREVLNLVAPAQARPLAAEFVRLASDLQPQVGDLSRLRTARENAEQPDLTLLHEATGWDARLIATAAIATRLSAAEETGLPQDALYGLLRVGLPSDKLQLARMSPEAFDQALGKARASGIVDLSDAHVAQVKKSFETFSINTRLAVQAPGSRATYGDLLKKLDLSENDQQTFAKLYLNHRDDAKSLWEKAANAGLGAIVPKLQKQGKLAFLTTNNPDLTAKLQSDLGDAGPEQLVKLGLYKKEEWLDRIDIIPPAYADAMNPKESYAEDMARKVRISYSTEVTWNMIETGELKIEGGNANLSAFLKNAIGKGFKLGQTPIDAFIKAHPDLFSGFTDTDRRTTTEMVKTLQRVYQITPGNDAMKALLNAGLLSAQDVLAYPLDAFLEQFGNLFPSEEQARLVYRKAEQVSNITYSLFSLAKELDSAPQVSVMSAPVADRKAAKENLVTHFPTMERLFGSLDFCECEHCRSVLSPAAYLVDLLQFLDREPKIWENTLKDWEKKHGNAPYPFKNMDAFNAFITKWHSDHPGDPDPNTKRTPYEVLIDRRPDLPHIQLTCENTNTALPQIDLVNEILEYYVANNALKADAALDTGDATTAELLAEPQHVITEAYAALQQARYPLTLPFDLWIETARQFTAYFDVPLWRLLETFRKRDDLFAPAEAYDRATIFFEALGLSPAEVAIFTNPDPLPKWFELYGFAKESDALTEAVDADTSQRIDLNSAKALSRRLGVTYKELVEIIQTGFVNPKLEALVTLRKLEVETTDVIFYQQHKHLLDEDEKKLSQPDSERLAEVKAFEQRLDALTERFKASGAGFNARTWLQAAQADKAFDTILVLADPDAGCNFDLTTLRYANGDKADALAFLKINLFVRLWRKLGWSIEETDRALQAFVPKNTRFETVHLAKQPLKTALIYLAHLKALDERARVGKQSRLKLITLWSDIATTGKKPLYAQLFLTRSVLKSAPVFDHPLGQYLSAAGIADMAQSSKHRVQLENVAPGDKIDPALFAAEPKVELSYDELQEVQHLSFQGVLSNVEKAALNALLPAPSPILSKLLDAVQEKAREFSLVKGHMLALQGALGLTANEISRILVDAGKSLDTAELSLPNVSLLYRYGMLARALKLSVHELITFKQLSGLDPFKLLHSDPLTTLKEDYPFSQTLRFVEVAEEVKESGLRIEDLEYLLRHRFDETGKYRPNREATLALLKAIAEGVRAIRTEHAVPDDAGAMSEEVLRQKLGLALSPDAVEHFLAMTNGTAEFTATKTGVSPADQLKSADFTDEPAIREVRYNDTRQEQKLTVRVFDPHRAGLEARHASSLFADLMKDIQARARKFFDNQLKKQKLRLDDEAGFLDDGDFSALFAPLKPLLKIAPGDTQQQIDDKQKENEKIERENQTELQTRRYRIAQAFLPFLQQRLIRQFIVQTLTAQTGADPALMESLLTDERLLAGPKPLLETFNATGERKITATFFAAADGTGASLATVSLVDADTGLKDKDGNLLRPAPANSARLEGYLEVPTSGAYRFYVSLDKQNAEAELRFDHLPDPLFWKGVVAADNTELGDKPQEYLELKPGIPYHFRLDLKKLNGGEARLLVQGETLPKGSVSQLTLYSLSAMAGAERVVTLLTKALHLVQSLGLSEREIRYLLTHTAAFGGLSLSELPTQSGNDTPEEKVAATERFTRFLRLATYARLKRDLAAGTEDLIGIFEANETTATDKLEKTVYPLIATLTRRDEATVKVTANALITAPTFENERPLLRLWEGLQVVERFGVPVASLREWTRIVSPAATTEQRFEIARDLKEAIKARFEPETWQRVAQPIFDKLRQRQRDALVSHVMHQHHFDRIEQLFEFFLIDPGVEPVVQTSRIRAATAAVQIFIHRCLLNLEPQVTPSAINSKQWQWMKRYPVWAGNRKLWLFPENVLEPEFRDDKTHLFTELEGKLLQSDVTNDLVEDAFFNYLKKLDELARLDIVAMYCEEQPLDPASNQLHVIGRTYLEPYKYFYRRYAHQMWTPWEPMPVEIEGNHIVPVIWRDRLNVFWVTFIDNPDLTAIPSDDSTLIDIEAIPKFRETAGTKKAMLSIAHGSASSTPKNVTEMSLGQLAGGLRSAVSRKLVKVQLHWSEYFQGGWSVRESGGYSASLTKPVSFDFDNAKVFIHATKDYDEENGEERGVKIHLGGEIDQAFYVVSRNSRPTRANREPAQRMPYTVSEVQANRYLGKGAFKVTFAQRIETEVGKGTKPPMMATPDILSQGGEFTLLPCANTITLGTEEIASLVTPVFYQDDRSNTFYVEPTFKEKTIEEWQEWVTHTPEPEVDWDHPDWWDKLLLEPLMPKQKAPAPVNPGDPIWRSEIDPRARFEMVSKQDWLANPSTVVQFDGELIGPTGHAGLVVRPTRETSDALQDGATAVNVNAGSAIVPGNTVVTLDNNTLASAGLTQAAGGLNVIGGNGLNSALLKNVNALKGF